MRTWLIPLAASILLWALTSQLNHYLSSLGIHIYLGGLLITYPALRLGFRAGLTATILIGLWADAAVGGPFGLQMALFTTGFSVLFHIRNRFPCDETAFGVFAALLANLGVYLAFSFALALTSPFGGSTWLRLFVDLIISQLVLTLVGPWFLALNNQAMAIGMDAEAS